MPDTIVLNDSDLPPFWMYSSPEGFVFRTDTFTSKNVSTKLANYASPDELVAVIKKVNNILMYLIFNINFVLFNSSSYKKFKLKRNLINNNKNDLFIYLHYYK